MLSFAKYTKFRAHFTFIAAEHYFTLRNYMGKNTNISGVGGWLALLVVGLMVIGPLLVAGRFYNEIGAIVRQYPLLEHSDKWQTYKQISLLILTTSIAINFIAGYRLWKLHFPESVWFAISALWLGGPFAGILIAISGIVILDGAANSFEIGKIFGELISSALSAGIWTIYLKRSARVRNTYKLPQKNATNVHFNSEVSHHDKSISQQEQESLSGFNPFRCSTKSSRRLSISLLITSLLLWFGWVGAESNGFSEVRPLGWLFIFGMPIAVYLSLLLATWPILRKAFISKDIRLLFSANLMWIFLVGTWGYIWHWRNVFDIEEYLALFILPLIGTWLSYFLLKWSKAS